MKRCEISTVAFYSLLLVSALLFLGCEIGSSDSATRTMGVDFTGFYDSTGTSNDFVSPANSGARVTSLNMRQSGDLLEAIDNNGRVFNGSANDSTLNSGTASAGFTLEGFTTAGQRVTISGTLSGSGTTGIMKGTWIEPDRYCYVDGDAVINPVQTNQPSPATLAISPVGPITLSGTGSTQPFTASGGSGTYSAWNRSNANLGELTSSGATATYQRNSNTGTNTISVTDSAGATVSVQVIQP